MSLYKCHKCHQMNGDFTILITLHQLIGLLIIVYWFISNSCHKRHEILLRYSWIPLSTIYLWFLIITIHVEITILPLLINLFDGKYYLSGILKNKAFPVQ